MEIHHGDEEEGQEEGREKEVRLSAAGSAVC
jgi:hypothetical protein